MKDYLEPMGREQDGPDEELRVQLSIAISLKRIADLLEGFMKGLTEG